MPISNEGTAMDLSKILERNVMQDLFEGVLGADFMGDFAKPDAEAFQKVCSTHPPHSISCMQHKT